KRTTQDIAYTFHIVWRRDLGVRKGELFALRKTDVDLLFPWRSTCAIWRAERSPWRARMSATPRRVVARPYFHSPSRCVRGSSISSSMHRGTSSFLHQTVRRETARPIRRRFFVTPWRALDSYRVQRLMRHSDVPVTLGTYALCSSTICAPLPMRTRRFPRP